MGVMEDTSPVSFVPVEKQIKASQKTREALILLVGAEGIEPST